MGDLEHFLHNDKIPALIRISIAHYQFETIHPFLDGNGRIGRLMITLFLVSQEFLSQPLLYLSSYFESDRRLYYDNLMIVRKENNLTQWIKYFLVGIEQTAHQAIDTLSTILDLKSETEQYISKNFGRRSRAAIVLLQHLFKHPIINVEQAKEATQLSFKAANDLVKMMVDHDILTEMTGQSRNRMFQFKTYIDAFK
jgi:Fic family protein